MHPSITGSVAIVELSKAVTESLTENEVDDIASEAADAYGAPSENVSVEVQYQTTGLISLDIDDSILKDDIIDLLIDEIAEQLDIHESLVEVTIDESGAARYTIFSDSAEIAKEIQNALENPEIVESLDNIIENVDGIEFAGFEVDSDIIVDVYVTVDTTGASNNLDNAATAVEEIFQQNGYNAAASSNTFNQK